LKGKIRFLTKTSPDEAKTPEGAAWKPRECQISYRPAHAVGANAKRPGWNYVHRYCSQPKRTCYSGLNGDGNASSETKRRKGPSSRPKRLANGGANWQPTGRAAARAGSVTKGKYSTTAQLLAPNRPGLKRGSRNCRPQRPLWNSMSRPDEKRTKKPSAGEAAEHQAREIGRAPRRTGGRMTRNNQAQTLLRQELEALQKATPGTTGDLGQRNSPSWSKDQQCRRRRRRWSRSSSP